MTQIAALLAVQFGFTADVTFDLRFTFGSGTTPVNVPLTTGTYKIHLTSAVTDLLRVLQTLANNALTAARGGGAEQIAVTLTDTGLVNLTMTGGSWATMVLSAPLSKILGIPTTTSAGNTATGTRLPWYVLGFVCAYGGTWQRRATGVVEEMPDGTVYSFGSGASAWRRKVRIEHLPRTPATRAAESFPGSAAYPDESSMGAVGSVLTDREWTLADNLANAQNVGCSFTTAFQVVRLSTTERYYLCRIGAESLLSQEFERGDPRWDAFLNLDLALVAPGTAPTGTRA